jgi:hypothetical protein
VSRPFWLLPALVGLALRVLGAWLLRPWHDEYFTCWAAQLPFHQLWEALRWDSGPPLPYLLVKLATLAGLPPLVAGRGLSVLAGTLAVIFLGKAAASPQAGTWTAWLFALHPLALMQSVEARAYGLLLAAVAASLFFLQGAFPGPVHWRSLSLALAVALYSHALGLLWLVSVLAWGLWRRNRQVLWACGLALALFSPWLPVMSRQPLEAVGWMAAAPFGLPLWMRWVGPLRLLPPLAGWGYTLEAPIPPGFLQGGAAALVLLGLLAAGSGPWLLFLGPMLLLLAASWLGLPVFFPGRGEALLLPSFLLLLGAGAGRFRRWLGVGLGALSLAGSLWVVLAWQGRDPRPEEQLAQALRATGEKGVVVTTGWWWLGLRFWLPPSWEVVHVPAAALRHPGWFRPGLEPASKEELEALRTRLLARAPGERAALLLTPGLQEAGALFQLARELGFRRGLVVPSGVLYQEGP